MKKFIKFEPPNNAYDETETISVFNHKHEYLGFIDFKKEWKVHKQWIFSADDGCFFTSGCLMEIIDMLNQLNMKGGYNVGITK